MKIKTLLAAILLATALRLPAATNDLTSRLQQGLFDEEASRDLNAAIADYQALAAQFDQDRQVAATAIYRLGECYRKLGQTNEAVTQYQRLIREFADQNDLVTLSRQNLTGLGVDSQPHFAERLQSMVSRAPSDAVTDDESKEIVRIQQMIQNSPDLINAPGEDRETPLIRAAGSGWLKVAGYLLDHGADVNFGASSGATALYEAAGVGNRAMVELLLSRGAEVNPPGPQPPGAVPTPLAAAVSRGFPAVVEVLLAAKADVNVPNSDGYTALHEALFNGQDKIAQMLLKAGANPNAKSNDGGTPLMAAPKRATPDTLQRLLTAGADPNITDNHGRTALSYTAECGSVPEIQVLLAAKADPNVGTLDLPLMCAISKGDPVAAECLLKAGANPNLYRSVDGNLGKTSPRGGVLANFHPVSTPLFFAIWTGQLPMVQLLLKYQADPNDTQTDGRSLLFNALDKPEILAALLDAGSHVDARDLTGNSYYNINGVSSKSRWTPLNRALLDNQPAAAKVVEILLNHGANPNLPDNTFRRTPLLWTVGWGDNRVPDRTALELLLAHQADPNLRDSDGRTLLDHLKSMSKNASPADQAALASLCDLLRQHGALDHLPDWNHITVTRPDANVSRPAFARDTNNWNQFTLLELVAVECRFLAATPASKGEEFEKDAFFDARYQSLPFPDLTRLRILRPTSDQKTNQEIMVNLGSSLQSGDCSNDTPLAWGDVVEIPETDHALKEDWSGFSDQELANLRKCLTRHVSIIVKDQTNIIALAPVINLKGETDQSTGIPGFNQTLLITTSIRSEVPYWLGPVLLKSGLVLTSSDLSRVHVTRRDPATGKSRACTVDCTGISQNQFNDPDLWLRDGDVIEIPEKP